MCTWGVVAVPDREPWTVRVDPEVRAAWREQIDEWDGENAGHVGYHLEQAMKEYIDTDRYSRIEDKLDNVLAHVSEGGSTHTQTTASGSGTVERARDIYQRIADNHGLVVKDDDVIRAIEDIAGADDRTVGKYKEMLKRRSLLFQHPADSPVWTTDREKWVAWVEAHVNNDPTMSVSVIIEEYGITIDRYDEVAAAMET